MSGLYNLSRENFQIKDLAHEIAKIVPDTEIKYVDMKFEDLRNYKVDNSHILSTGWESKYSLEYGINQIYQIIDTKRLKNINDIVYSNAKYMNWLEEA